VHGGDRIVLGYLQILSCVGMILLFLGGGAEHAARQCDIVPGMSPEQVTAAWNQPLQVTECEAPSRDGEERAWCVWSYEEPCRMVVFRDGEVVRCVRR